MLTLRQLREWFDDVKQIIFDVQVSAGNLRRILHPANSAEEKALQAGFFDHYMNLLRNSLVIQLCKLFVSQDKERRNFRKLFNRFKYDPYDKRLKKLLTENRGIAHLAGYKRELVFLVDRLIPILEEHAETIHKMKVLRDRHFAHTDPGKELPDLPVEELLNLVSVAEDVYNTLNRALFNQEFLFRENDHWSVEAIITALAKQEGV